MWGSRSPIPLMLLAFGCASGQETADQATDAALGSGKYQIALNIDGPIAMLSDYRGDDADAKLDKFVRGYCGGAYRPVSGVIAEKSNACSRNCALPQTRSVAFECVRQ